MCVCVCAYICIVLLYSRILRFALWFILKKKFRNGNDERKINQTPHKNLPHPPAINKCRKYSTAKNTTTMSTSTGTLSFFFARTCDRNWVHVVASTRKTRREEKIFFGSAYSLFCCRGAREMMFLKISNAKKEFVSCSHHRRGARKKAKRKNEREKWANSRPSSSASFTSYRFLFLLFKVSVPSNHHRSLSLSLSLKFL